MEVRDWLQEHNKRVLGMIEAYYLDSGGGYHECAHMLKLIKLYTEKFINFIICKLYSISKEYLLEFCKN